MGRCLRMRIEGRGQHESFASGLLRIGIRIMQFLWFHPPDGACQSGVSSGSVAQGCAAVGGKDRTVSHPSDRDDITALLGVSGLFLICVGLVWVALAFTPWAPLWEGVRKIARDIPGPA